MASARCGAAMVSAPSRSAMVRASLSTRWNARAESCSRCIAARKSGCASSATAQWARTSAGPISALAVMRLPLARRLHPRAHDLGALALAPVGQLLVLHARHLHVDVDAIQQRTADALLVAGDGAGGAGAFARG